MEWIIQGVGLLGALFNLIAYQLNKHSKIMVFTTLNAFAFTLQYFLLGAYTGMVINLIAAVRNVLFAYLVKRGKNMLPYTLSFSALMIASGVFTWAGIISLLPIFGKTIETLSFSMKSPKLVRAISVPSLFCWVAYNGISRSLGGLISDFMALGSIVVKEIQSRKKNLAENETPDTAAEICVSDEQTKN